MIQVAEDGVTSQKSSSLCTQSMGAGEITSLTHGRSHESRLQRNSLKAHIWAWFIVDRHNEVHANAFGLSEIRG